MKTMLYKAVSLMLLCLGLISCKDDFDIQKLHRESLISDGSVSRNPSMVWPREVLSELTILAKLFRIFKSLTEYLSNKQEMLPIKADVSLISLYLSAASSAAFFLSKISMPYTKSLSFGSCQICPVSSLNLKHIFCPSVLTLR